VPAAVKVELIDRLGMAGLKAIEATAFVSPKWVPQMGDAAEVMASLPRRHGVSYPVLVPNLKGFEQALAAGVEEIAVFAAASEAFSQKNINCSIAEAWSASAPSWKRRGRTASACAATSPASPAAPTRARCRRRRRRSGVAPRRLGCYEISLGDTIGVGTPAAIRRMLDEVALLLPVERLAGHYHDTYGMALANIYASLERGVAVFDASVAGLGGCPYAAGASGNVATEDVVYLMNGLGIETGIDLDRLVDAGAWISKQLKRQPASRVALAILARRAAATAAGA
jgi:hydroxymethylglutaryl-CoA lyase